MGKGPLQLPRDTLLKYLYFLPELAYAPIQL